MLTKTTLGLALTAAVISAALVAGHEATAADHLDAPGVQSDAAADITDFYAWADGQTATAIIAFAGLAEAGAEGTYDSGVLYGIHIDNDGDGVSDRDIWARFGDNADGDWGMQVTGLSDEPLVAPVEEAMDSGDVRIFGGTRDDGFFFDLEGFQATLEEATLMFDSARDSFAGTNTTAIAVEAPLDAFTDGEAFTIWASTRRAQ